VSPGEISQKARVERETKRLSVLVRLLCVLLLTVITRALVGGFTEGIGAAAALVAALMVMSVALLRKGRRLELALSTSTQTPDRAL
jgi:hypothetical protein